MYLPLHILTGSSVAWSKCWNSGVVVATVAVDVIAGVAGVAVVPVAAVVVAIAAVVAWCASGCF